MNPNEISRTYTVDSVERTAIVAEPLSPVATSPPAVLFFHGRGAKAESAFKIGRIRKAWPEALVVYPQGLPNDTGVGPPGIGWQRGAGIGNDRDVKFVDSILSSLTTEYGVEPTRVYACGMSNGGTFALLLMALRAEKFAAFAEAAGAAGRFLNELATPRRVLFINGRKDHILPFWAAEKARDRVLSLSGAVLGEMADGIQYWRQGSDERFVGMWAHDGGHVWPKQADERIVEFFQAHV